MMEVTNLLERALNIRAQYHRILSGNIANVETPNYKEKDIDFQTEIQRNIGIPNNVEIRESNDGDVIGSIDGNTVNMENQVVKMTENHMLFTSLVQVISKKFSMMRYVISEGRR
jgi:flagellar basal-body rod protein FlgB